MIKLITSVFNWNLCMDLTDYQIHIPDCHNSPSLFKDEAM